MKRVATLSLLVLLLVNCSRQEAPAESYYVVSHDAASGEWVIIGGTGDDPNRVQITMTCDFSERGTSAEPLTAPNSCALVVGETLVPNRFPTTREDFLDIRQGGDKVFITRGDGAERVHQQFSVRALQHIQR